jgi:hypothetical protein
MKKCLLLQNVLFEIAFSNRKVVLAVFQSTSRIPVRIKAVPRIRKLTPKTITDRDQGTVLHRTAYSPSRERY